MKHPFNWHHKSAFLAAFFQTRCLKTALLGLLVLLLGHISVSEVQAQSRLRMPDGQEVFLSGMNVAWQDFANDVGDTPINEATWAKILDDVKGAGGNTIRWWLYTNASRAPKFNNGYVSGLGTQSVANIKKVLDLAQQRDMLVVLCLFSFDLLQTGQYMVNGDNNVRMLTTDAGIKACIDNCIVPTVTQIGQHPSIACWEIFNEPEGMLTNGGWTDRRIGWYDIQRFVNRAAGAIHRAVPNVYVSNGAKHMHSLTNKLGQKNYYSDTELKNAGGDADGYLDFYMVHYYDNEGAPGTQHSPFHNNYSYWGSDKPMIVAEFGAKGYSNNFTMSSQECYRQVYTRGYAGALSWTYTNHDGFGGLPDATPGLNYLKTNYPASLAYSAQPTPNFGTNIALNKKVVVSTVEAGSGNVASNITDASNTTRWSSEYTNNQYVVIDLGAVYAVKNIVLNWEAAYGKSYQIQVSTDSTNWTTVFQTTTGNGAKDILTNLTGTGRYVRMLMTERGTQWGYSLYAFEVYGDPSCGASITANGPTTFCQGGSVTLTASSGASYIWKNGTTTVGTSATFNATAAGSYTVEVTNANGCKATSAATTVTVNSAPTASITANGPTTFCSGGSVTLSASSGASYVWKNGTTTVGTSSTFNATTAGSYTVEVTNAAGCKATSNATTISVDAAPAASITANGPTTFCTGGSVILTASAGASYIWKNGTTTVGTSSTFNATAAGSYTVEVTNANGCKATSAATTVTVNAAPTATTTANGPTTFCTGGSVTLTASTGASYIWKNGTTTVGTSATFNATTAGSYIVEVTNANGCKATSNATTVSVNAAPAASITASGTTTFCTDGSVTLSASTGSSYIWKNGTTTVGTSATFNATTSGSYTVEVTNAAGCKATSAATTVTVNAAPTATITANGPTTFCQGGSVTLSASAGTSYVWKNGTTTVGTAATFNATTSGSYTVEVTNANGCKATSVATTVTVNSAPAASITASGTTTFCTDGSVTLSASTGSSYIWKNGTTTVGTSATFNATTSGSYTVEVTNAAGCKATSAATTVTVNAAPTATITANGPTTFCQGGSVTLSASAGTSYVWKNGTTTVGTAATFNETTSGSYTVEVTNAKGCKATSVATTVTVNAAPTASITANGPTTFCAGGSVTLTATAGTSYIWKNGTTTVGTSATFNATTAGSYTVEVTNANGCKATSAATTVAVNAAPAVSITANGPTTFCQGGSVTLSTSSGTSYIWRNGTTSVGTSVAFNATTSGSYTVEVTNVNGCKATSAVTTVTVGSASSWYQDQDNDGIGDATASVQACSKPAGYVATSGDTCPLDALKTEPGNCGCGVTEGSCLDCAGVPNGTAALDVCNICSGGTTGIVPKTDISECTTTSVSNASALEYVSVYPNPFAQTATIDTKGALIHFYIYNVSGALVETVLFNGKTQIGEQLKSGIYLVRYAIDSNWYQFKLIKE